MRTLPAALAVAAASGGSPPSAPAAPTPRTVVARGTGTVSVTRPARLTNPIIARALGRARRRAVPRAFAAARTEARLLPLSGRRRSS